VVEAFDVVMIVVIVGATIAAIFSLVGMPGAYQQIGKGGLSLNDGTDRPAREPSPGGGAALRERDDEIRQMLAARNERRERRGEAPLDVETELARLTAPAIDAGLEGEIRLLVIARNERRERRGQPALDVEAEVARQIAELSG